MYYNMLIVLLIVLSSSVSLSQTSDAPIAKMPNRNVVFTDLNNVASRSDSLWSNKINLLKNWSPEEVVSKNYPKLQRDKNSKNVILAQEVKIGDSVDIDLGKRDLIIIAKKVSIGSSVKLINSNNKQLYIYAEDLDIKDWQDKKVTPDQDSPQLIEYTNGKSLFVTHYGLNGWEDILRYSSQVKKNNADGKKYIDKSQTPDIYLMSKLYELMIFDYRNNSISDAYEKAQAIKALTRVDIINEVESQNISLLMPRDLPYAQVAEKTLSYIKRMSAGLDINGFSSAFMHRDQVSLLKGCGQDSAVDNLLENESKLFFLKEKVLDLKFIDCSYANILRKQSAVEVSNLSLEKNITNFEGLINRFEGVLLELGKVEDADKDQLLIKISDQIIKDKYNQQVLAVQNQIKKAISTFKALDRRKNNLYIKNRGLRRRIDTNLKVAGLVSSLPTGDAELDTSLYGAGQAIGFVGSIVGAVFSGNPGGVISSFGGIMKDSALKKQQAEQRRIEAARRNIEKKIRLLNLNEQTEGLRAEIRINSNALLDIVADIQILHEQLALEYSKIESFEKGKDNERARVNAGDIDERSSEKLLMALYEVYLDSLRRSFRQTFNKLIRIYGRSLNTKLELSTCNILNGSFFDADLGALLSESTIDNLLKNKGKVDITFKYKNCLSEIKSFINLKFNKITSPVKSVNDIYILQTHTNSLVESIDLYSNENAKCLTDELAGNELDDNVHFIADKLDNCEVTSDNFTRDLLSQLQVNFEFKYTEADGLIKSIFRTYFDKPKSYVMPQITDAEVVYEENKCSFAQDNSGKYVTKSHRSEEGCFHVNGEKIFCAQEVGFDYTNVSFLISLGEIEHVSTGKNEGLEFFKLNYNTLDYFNNTTTHYQTNGIKFVDIDGVSINDLKNSTQANKVLKSEKINNSRGSGDFTNLNNILERSPMNKWVVDLSVNACRLLDVKKESSIYKECMREALSCYKNIKLLLKVNYLELGE